MTFHLSHEQLCDHLFQVTPVAGSIPSSSSPATTQSTVTPTVAPSAGFHAVEDHLRACPLCAAELRSLQASLGNFQAAATRFADQELSLLRSLSPNRVNLRAIAAATPHPAPRLHQKPFVWAMAAGLVIAASLGTILPHGLHHHPVLRAAAVSASTPSPESDQALLEEVDNDLSSNVPSAMQPLSDPTSTTSQATSQATTQDEASAPHSSQVPARNVTHE